MSTDPNTVDVTPLFLDVEVLQQEPYPFMIPDVATMAPPKNYKKPAAIAEWRKEKEEGLLDELREQSSLEPLLGGIIVVVGVAVGNDEPTILVAETLDEAGEGKLLARVERAIMRRPTNPLVTWNGSGYDYAFIGKRALRHGLYGLARAMYREKPWSRRHVDIFETWRQHDRGAKGRLVDVARFLGVVDPPDPITGADVATAIQAGRIADVTTHCRADILRLREIYWRLRAAGWVVNDDVVPDDLPILPLRVSERDALLAACAELQVGLDMDGIRAAALEAGVPFHTSALGSAEDGPDVDHCTLDVLRRYHAALQGFAAARFRADVVDGVGVADGAEGVGVGSPAAGAHHAPAENGQAA